MSPVRNAKPRRIYIRSAVNAKSMYVNIEEVWVLKENGTGRVRGGTIFFSLNLSLSFQLLFFLPPVEIIKPMTLSADSWRSDVYVRIIHARHILMR